MVLLGNMIIVGFIKDKSPCLLQINFSKAELHLGQCCRGVHHLPFNCHSCFKSFLRFQKSWSYLISKTDNVVSTYHCFVHPSVILDLHQRHRAVVLPPKYSCIEIPPYHKCIFQILSDKLYQNIWYCIKHKVSEQNIWYSLRMRPPFCLWKPGQPARCQQASQHILEYQRQWRNGQQGKLEQNNTIGDGGITVDFWIIKVHTSNWSSNSWGSSNNWGSSNSWGSSNTWGSFNSSCWDHRIVGDHRIPLDL